MTESANTSASAEPMQEILLLISTHCAHCAAVLQIVTGMVKQGEIASLKIVNLEKSPALAAQLGVRSVPRLQIGELVFEGALTREEIKDWIAVAGSTAGESRYLADKLSEGEVHQVIEYIQQHPDALQTVATFMLDPDAKINLKLGIGVIFEEFARQTSMDAVIPQLQEYVTHADARVRADACYYLSLTGREEFSDIFERCLQDADGDVREIARESLDALSDA